MRPEGPDEGGTHGRRDERKSPCVLQDFVPFGAAAQKEKEKEKEQIAQGQYVVSDTRCPALSDCEME